MITANPVSFVVLFFISQKGEKKMGMMQSELIEKGLKQAFIHEIEEENTRRSKKKKERLSRREIEDLM
ncbi:hypothetical protein AM499_07640 [Bacillus sp. FJAT-22090]|uniref:hypothetical protein n=1 Tax=Bacillus sp. FJAT-22090 TaxID=1581038 RepID=UPI0006AE8145|nr:hypothetical protein [Bacillus sp. FJAT-22090]ALC85709.1 hypothetical protein AM499_07640 [Bacillus sp. FJAT-22090]